MLRFLGTLSILLSFAIIVIAQNPQQDCYIRLDDASGFNTDVYQDSLDKYTCDLLEFIPAEFRNDFRVYDFGFYPLIQSVPAGFEPTWNRLIDQVQAQSPYYLLLGKQSDKDGIYTKFWVNLKIPIDAAYPCLTQEKEQTMLQRIKIEMDKTYESLNRAHTSYHLVEIAGINKLATLMDKAVNCCIANAKTGNCSNCDYTYEEIVENLEYMGYTAFETEDIEVNIQPQTYSGFLESDYRIDFIDPLLGNPSLTDIKDDFLNKLSQYGEVSGKVYYLDETNCNEFEELIENEFAFTDSPVTLQKKQTDKLYDETIIVLNFVDSIPPFPVNRKAHVYHKISYLIDQSGQGNLIPTITPAPWNCYIRKVADDDHLDNTGLERTLFYAKGIYERQGYGSVNFIKTENNAQIVDALELHWYDGFLNLKRLPDEDNVYGESAQDSYIPSRSFSYVNVRNPSSIKRSGESKYYSLGYLLAHELLHQITRQTYYHFNPRDLKMFKSEDDYDKKYYVHHNHIPNLNMEGEVLVKEHGGIPVLPPGSGVDQKEKIISHNAYWAFIGLDPIFRPQNN